MQLPLELREEFGKYAFPDEDYGAKAIEPILPFLDGMAIADTYKKPIIACYT